VGKNVGRSIAFAMFAAALSLSASFAHAAGLGKITVLSSLGQPLLAEIEIVQLQAGEEEGLNARLPAVEAFTAAGIEPSAILNSVRFSIQRRNNRPLVRITSTQPVDDPFLEMLVELQWSTGRLVREYTFLLDPPEYKAQQQALAAAAPKPAPEMKPEPKPEPAAPAAEAPKPEPKPEAAAAAAAAAAAEVKPEAAPEVKPEATPEAKPEPKIEAQPLPATPAAAAPSTPGTPPPVTMYEVKKGDTLSAIARQNLPAGVTLNQMLIALYRNNPDAFIRENINLVRAGHILNIPDGDAVGTIERADANRLVSAHIADFNEYRSRLAGAAVTAESAPSQREAAGRIEPKPAAVPSAGAQDQLKLSKADPQKPAAAGARAAQGDDAVARERALKEAQSRVADLEKNVTDLQKLLELKNQQLAELEKRAGGGKPAATPAPAPAAKAPEKPAAEPAKPPASPPAAAAKPAPEPAKPAAPAPPPQIVAKADTKPAAEPAKPAAQAPPPAAEPAKPAPAPAPAAKAPEQKAAPKPPAQAQEPSLVDEFLDNPIALGGLGGVVLLLVGYGAWAWSRKKKAQARFQDSVLGATSGAASVFGTPAAAPASGAQGVSQASVSQPAGLEAEEVDPIAEADVYMAYGRDAQAEEILKEALQKDSNRTAVHVKLLEIYANRKDTQAFEQTAAKLKSLTNGAGPEWEKAAALGRSIDPQNGLYGGAGASAAGAASAAAAPTLDFDLGGAGAAPASAPDISLDAPTQEPSGASGGNIDFDLGGGAAAAQSTPPTDFTPEGTLIMGAQQPESTASGLDFDLGTAKTEAPAPAPAAPAAPPAADGGLDFDLKLDDMPGAKAEASAPATPDLSSISLDLGAAAEPSPSGAGSSDPKWQEVATKLDLAKAYEEMGDKDGSRELLNEVMKDGDAAQKGQAQQLLAKLG
jgi:pilus assembly protein FimV